VVVVVVVAVMVVTSVAAVSVLLSLCDFGVAEVVYSGLLLSFVLPDA
jgi:hypothetical protein